LSPKAQPGGGDFAGVLKTVLPHERQSLFPLSVDGWGKRFTGFGNETTADILKNLNNFTENSPPPGDSVTPISGGANRNVSLCIGVTRKIVKKLRKRYSLVKKRKLIVTIGLSESCSQG
jgi:hypothetical protein